MDSPSPAACQPFRLGRIKAFGGVCQPCQTAAALPIWVTEGASVSADPADFHIVISHDRTSSTLPDEIHTFGRRSAVSDNVAGKYDAFRSTLPHVTQDGIESREIGMEVCLATQGSGKSIVMVLLAKWILENLPKARGSSSPTARNSTNRSSRSSAHPARPSTAPAADGICWRSSDMRHAESGHYKRILATLQAGLDLHKRVVIHEYPDGTQDTDSVVEAVIHTGK